MRTPMPGVMTWKVTVIATTVIKGPQSTSGRELHSTTVSSQYPRDARAQPLTFPLQSRKLRLSYADHLVRVVK